VEPELKYRPLEAIGVKEFAKLFTANGWDVEWLPEIENSTYFFDTPSHELFGKNQLLRLRHKIEGGWSLGYKRTMSIHGDKPYLLRFLIRARAEEGGIKHVKSFADNFAIMKDEPVLTLTESSQYKRFLIRKNNQTYALHFSDKDYLDSTNQTVTRQGIEIEGKGKIGLSREMLMLELLIIFSREKNFH